jgi:hypothetical protein
VLVSSTLRDLVIGSGLEFDDRGAHQLNGVPAFGGNGFRRIVGAGVSAFGHHHSAVASGLGVFRR